MSDADVPAGQQRQTDRFRATLAAWFDLHGGYRCGLCQGADWILLSYQRHAPSWYGGPTGDDLETGSYTVGWVGCQRCQQITLYNLTAISAGTILDLGPPSGEPV